MSLGCGTVNFVPTIHESATATQTKAATKTGTAAKPAGNSRVNGSFAASGGTDPPPLLTPSPSPQMIADTSASLTFMLLSFSTPGRDQFVIALFRRAQSSASLCKAEIHYIN